MARACKRELSLWFAAGFASVPLSVLFHELGHYTAGKLLGWRDLAFHYSSVDLASEGSIVASVIHAPWKAALVYVAGPAVSVAIIFFATLWVGRPGGHAVPTAFGLSSAVRLLSPLATGTVLVLRRILTNHAPFDPNLDEFNFATNLGMPPLLFLFSNFFAAAIGLFWTARRLRHRELAFPLVSLALGIATGFAFYFGFLGPHLLP